MRSKVTALAAGLTLIIAGAVLIGGTLGLWDASVFFEGWWTLFLIVPAVISMAGQGLNAGNVILLTVGLVLLADARDWLGSVSAWSVIVPAGLIAIGGYVIWKGLSRTGGVTDRYGNRLVAGDGLSAVFSESNVTFAGQPFTGATVQATFGSAKLDLRGAVIAEDVVVDVTTIFAGTEIVVSPGTNVRVDSMGIFGGVDNDLPQAPADAAGPVVHVRSTAIFGGLEIKAG